MSTTSAENCKIFLDRTPVLELAAFYRENGFLVVENALEGDEIAALNHDAAKICRGDYGTIPGLVPAAPGESDNEVLRRHLCIHFPHKMSATIFNAICHPSIVRVLTAIV